MYAEAHTMWGILMTIITREFNVMKKYYWFVGLSALIIASLACGLFSRGKGSSGASDGTGGTGHSGYNTKFPLPNSIVNFTETGNSSINFQTRMSVKDTLAFYREAFGKLGLKERTDNTALTDSTFSIVFDGDPSGQAVVIQGVDLGNGLTNVNIRYEKV
jgi:hypothetical protein